MLRGVFIQYLFFSNSRKILFSLLLYNIIYMYMFLSALPDQSDRKISEVVGGTYSSNYNNNIATDDGQDDDDDLQQGSGPHGCSNNGEKTKTKKKNKIMTDFFTKAKKVVLFPPFTKSNKHFNKTPSSSPSSSNILNCNYKRRKRRRRWRRLPIGSSCFCLKQPPTLESSSSEASSTIRDPNHPNFTLAMLKSLIESNDFYAKESNPHLD